MTNKAKTIFDIEKAEPTMLVERGFFSDSRIHATNVFFRVNLNSHYYD